VILSAPVLGLAALLGAAGLAKVARPAPTARALRSVGLPVPAGLVRAGAAAEVAVGGGFVLFGGWLAAGAVALSYAGFAVFVGAALARGGTVSSCGCFGEPDTPPTLTHLLVCAAGAAGAAAAASTHPVGAWALVSAHPAQAPALLLLVACTAYCGYLLMAVAPRLAARRLAR